MSLTEIKPADTMPYDVYTTHIKLLVDSVSEKLVLVLHHMYSYLATTVAHTVCSY